MRDALISSATDLTEHTIIQQAPRLDVDVSRFRPCFSEDEHSNDIQRDIAALQITGTPTFVIGKSAPGHLVGKEVLGAQPFSTFEQIIQTLLATKPH